MEDVGADAAGDACRGVLNESCSDAVERAIWRGRRRVIMAPVIVIECPVGADKRHRKASEDA